MKILYCSVLYGDKVRSWGTVKIITELDPTNILSPVVLYGA